MAATIFIYDDIGPVGSGYSSDEFQRELSRTEGDLEVHINSGGGSVIEGLGIYNAILDARIEGRKISTWNDGAALSIASVIFQAGSPRVISNAALVMVHLPFTPYGGNVEELKKSITALEKVAEQLVAIYTKISGQPEATVKKWLDVETWFDAKEAIAAGLADVRKTEAATDWTAALSAITNSGFKIPENYRHRIRWPIEQQLAKFRSEVHMARSMRTIVGAKIFERAAVEIAAKVVKMPGRTNDDLDEITSALESMPGENGYAGMPYDSSELSWR